VARADDLTPRLFRAPPSLTEGPNLMTSIPAPEDTERLLRFLQGQPSWSAFWDKAHGLWRAAEDDPHSSLYIESRDVETVIGYIAANA
jgi:hypothetical protein